MGTSALFDLHDCESHRHEGEVMQMEYSLSVRVMWINLYTVLR